MYNFNLEKNESLISVFDEVLIKQNDNQKLVSVAISDKRILLLDYVSIEPFETLKATQASHYIKMKEVFFSKKLKEIKSLENKSLYHLVFKDDFYFEFDNDDLYKLLKNVINGDFYE